ncbi:MAG: PilZ domain-containing protein [Candidatus Omnitrophica bacterium]|nr:PilZ domain-containing protein [Candidatus Omnitrophota bacterium]
MIQTIRINDRRRYQRLALNVSVHYRVKNPWYVRIQYGDHVTEAVTLNLSEGGMALLTTQGIPAHTSLDISFTLFKVDRHGEVNFFTPVEIEGEVRSTAIHDSDQYRLSICFVKKNSQTKNRITDFIKLAS